MSSAPKEIVNRSTGERIVFLRTAEETEGELLEMDDFWAHADHQTPAHIHPEMEERWEVITGEVRFKVDEIAQMAAPGDTIIAPPGTPHSACSVGSEPAHLRIQMRPALRWQEFVERLFALASPAPGTFGSDSLTALMQEFSREIAPVPR
jgi:quercetin dioxygenase-like cupin family protein